MRTLILRRLLLRDVLAADEKYVGVLLPPSVRRRASPTPPSRWPAASPCNLNYTVSADVMNACIAKAGIRHVLTSRKVMEKLELRSSTPRSSTRRLQRQGHRGDKLAGAVLAYATPAMLARPHPRPAPASAATTC